MTAEDLTRQQKHRITQFYSDIQDTENRDPDYHEIAERLELDDKDVLQYLQIIGYVQ